MQGTAVEEHHDVLRTSRVWFFSRLFLWWLAKPTTRQLFALDSRYECGFDSLLQAVVYWSKSTNQPTDLSNCARYKPSLAESNTDILTTIAATTQGMLLTVFGTGPLAAHLAAVELINSDPAQYLGNASFRIER
jgi:hypothetical protein